MKVNYYEDKMTEENRVDVFYSEMDSEINHWNCKLFRVL